MKLMRLLTQLVTFFLLITISAMPCVYAQVINPVANAVSELDIQKALDSTQDSENLQDRMLEISAYFLNRPYSLGPGGEGEDGDLDQRPLSTWEKFDCVTYVEAVMAMAMVYPISSDIALDLDTYYENIKLIKYHSKDISFLTRNHFTELDWLPYLNKIKMIRDITRSVYYFAPEKSKYIDKQQWFLQKTVKDLYLPDASEDEKIEILSEFKQQVLAEHIPAQTVKLSYIPFDILKLNHIQKRLPRISIFSLVRGDHPTNPNIPVMVSHQGFLIRKADNQLYVRHASTKTMQVMDVKFSEYIELRLKDGPWPSLGLNLQTVLE